MIRRSKNIVSVLRIRHQRSSRLGSENDSMARIESPDGSKASARSLRDRRRQHAGVSRSGMRLSQRRLPALGASSECHTISGLTAANILETSIPDEFWAHLSQTKSIASLLLDADLSEVLFPRDRPEIRCASDLGAYHQLCVYRRYYSSWTYRTRSVLGHSPALEVAPPMCAP